MTSNRRIKRIIRGHMAENGLNYPQARLELEASGMLLELELESKSTSATVTAPRLGQVLTVASPKGGSGKTTLSLALGGYLARHQELKVIVLDLDVRDGEIGFLTGFWKPTVMKLRRFGISKSMIEETLVHDEGLGVDLLLAPRRPDSADELPGVFYEELIEQLRQSYDYIILDTSVNYLESSVTQAAYGSADHILLLSETTSPALSSMARWIQKVTESKYYGGMGISKNSIGIVLNRTEPGRHLEVSSTVLTNAQEVPILGSIPNLPTAVNSAVNDQALERILEIDEIRLALRGICSKIATV